MRRCCTVSCFQISPGSSTSIEEQLNRYLPSIPQIIQDKQVMPVTVGEAETHSHVTFFWGLLRMNTPVLADQQNLLSISFVRTLVENLLKPLYDRDGCRKRQGNTNYLFELMIHIYIYIYRCEILTHT